MKADAATRTLTVKQGTDEQTYVLAADAELLAGKKALPPADLASGVASA